MILTSPLRRANSTLERVANISICDICTRWSVFSGTVTYSPVSDRWVAACVVRSRGTQNRVDRRILLNTGKNS